ncbi:MAG: hypothetical protein ACYSSO_14135 [Planctomycetota bacterium]|jgi:hypothetical protein
MKKQKITQSVSLIVITLSSIFLFLSESYGAKSKGSKTQTSPKKQLRQMPKRSYWRVNRTAVSPSSFKPDMPFSEAIDILRNLTIPPINIVVLWKDLEENADIYRDTPIGMNGLSGVPLKTHLKVLLMSVAGDSVEKLRYVVEDGVILIATQGSLPRRNVTRIYDVTDLVSEPANYGQIGRMLGMQNMMMSGMSGMMGGMGGGMMGGMGGGMMPFGGSGFGGMMPFGGTGFGGMMPFGGTGFGGQGFNSSPNTGAFGGFNRVRTGR